jgi:hypothetical protein
LAFLRFSRDKRGYEHFYLMEPAGRGRPRPRVLFWFRTPPNIRVGRKPFAADVRRALEERYPDVTFDWTAIVQTPIPPPVEPERWRERRRLERAMRAAQNEDAPTPEEAVAEPPQPRAARTAGTEAASGSTEESAAAKDGSGTSNLTAGAMPDMAAATPDGRPRRRKRRRRGRKGPAVQTPRAEMSGAQSVEEPAVQDSEEPDGDRGDEA